MPVELYLKRFDKLVTASCRDLSIHRNLLRLIQKTVHVRTYGLLTSPRGVARKKYQLRARWSYASVERSFRIVAHSTESYATGTHITSAIFSPFCMCLDIQFIGGKHSSRC